MAYTCFRKLEKNEGKFNWFLFYFHRYVRWVLGSEVYNTWMSLNMSGLKGELVCKDPAEKMPLKVSDKTHVVVF